ncbi:MAG: hypothetical protein COA78_38250 [Blastopirellula sp.]|nr:MAG: hypothetical protein COA78_38250 [Blastopirellula sp.]
MRSNSYGSVIGENHRFWQVGSVRGLLSAVRTLVRFAANNPVRAHGRIAAMQLMSVYHVGKPEVIGSLDFGSAI